MTFFPLPALQPTSSDNMPETAESHMYSLTANRTCVIEITNGSVYYCLYNSK